MEGVPAVGALPSASWVFGSLRGVVFSWPGGPVPFLKVAEWYKGRMVLGGSGKVSFGRRIRAGPYLRIQSELYTHSEVVSSPK